ncbi:MAG: hypothetical protein E7666_07095 [Ruminococcaceae bacterium]|nr:hypothetical protein [Oscillospiraceae bacterium]
MKAWFQKIGARMARFMYGRYGDDALNRVLLFAALLFLLIGYFPHMWIFTLLSVALLAWSMVRCYSRNIPKRQRELQAWLRFWGRIRGFFSLTRSKWRDRKTHRYFKCSKCRAVLRVPRGKGMIDITCPRCGAVTVKKS